MNSDRTISTDELVQITSCLDVPHADLAQMALAREGIPAALGNANFLLWSWDNSNAVGGVTVHVLASNVQRAREVLTAARTKPSASLPPWICSSCGQEVAGQWDVCWHCGHWADGSLDSANAEESRALPEGDADAGTWLNLPRLIGAVAVFVLVVLMLKHGFQVPVMVAPLVVVLIAFLWRFEPSSDQDGQPREVAGASDSPSYDLTTTRSEVSKAIVRRAWQAAVIGVFIFPPLGFYSMRLLWKLGPRDTPLSRADNWRCWTAFFLNIAAILYCLVFAGGLFFAFLGVFA